MTKEQQRDANTKLADYLERHVPGFRGPIEIRKFSGGQSNPTFLITSADGKYVLRRKPEGQLLKSAHAVDREYTVIKALADSRVPVARAYLLCTDDSVLGSMFYLMSFEDGEVHWNPALPDVDREQRAHYHLNAVEVLADLHDVDLEKRGLTGFGKPGNYFERQTATWTRQYRASETSHLPHMEALLEWLPAHIPDGPEETCLIHGDYNFENLMFHAGEPRIRAVLDWELSTLGHPFSDLAYFCMRLRLPGTHSVKGLGELDRPSAGIPTENELIRHYCELRGLDAIENWNFYMAFSFFRLAAITQGVYKRALDGNASSERALEVGRMASPLAEMGAAQIS